MYTIRNVRREPTWLDEVRAQRRTIVPLLLWAIAMCLIAGLGDLDLNGFQGFAGSQKPW